MAGFITPTSLALPLRDDHGTLRVGATRVTLDTVVGSFNLGAGAEEIVRRFPSLQLSDVFAVLSFYLSNRDEVDAYLAERKKIGDEYEAMARAHPSAQGFRERLVARRASGESS